MIQKAKCNEDKLIVQAGMGEIRQPFLRLMPWQISAEGKPMILPRMGSITYNAKIGDCVYGMEGDHVEPGVSIKNTSQEENNAINILSCIGNKATVITGEAKGENGFITGKHGGVEHVLVYFKQSTLEKLTLEDKIQIRMCGRGMKIEGFEESVHCINMSPELFHKMDIIVEDRKLKVPVTAKVPPQFMGSGMGEFSAMTGDYDIMTSDREELKKYGLDKLRYGDIVLLQDCDNTYGRGYKKGAVSIGVVVHSDCILLGHGPGVTVLFSSKEPIIEGYYDSHANLAEYMKI